MNITSHLHERRRLVPFGVTSLLVLALFSALATRGESAAGRLTKLEVTASNTVSAGASASKVGEIWTEFDANGDVARYAAIYRDPSSGSVFEVAFADHDGMTIHTIDGPECELQVDIGDDLNRLGAFEPDVAALLANGWVREDDSTLRQVVDTQDEAGRLNRTERVLRLDSEGRLASQVGTAFVDGGYSHEFRTEIVSYTTLAPGDFPTDILEEVSCD